MFFRFFSSSFHALSSILRACKGKIMNGQDSIHSVPDDLRDLIPNYLRNRRNELKELPDRLKNGDYNWLQRLGHNLKGSGDGYGFPYLSSIGDRMEIAAEKKDTTTLQTLVQSLFAAVAHLEQELRQLADNAP